MRERINDAYEKALYSERQLLTIHMERAKLGEKERASLLERFDDTKLLEEDNKLKEDRLALDKQLQEALDKQVYTEREVLQRKMEGLRYSKEEIQIRLKQFDQEKQLREEAEKRVEAEKEAVRAYEEQLRTVERLMDKLEPQRRSMSRAEQLQGTMSELAGETSDPFTLAQADIKRVNTLVDEESRALWDKWAEAGLNALDHVGPGARGFCFQGEAARSRT